MSKREKILSIFRHLQTYFPALQDVRFKLRRNYCQITRHPHEDDFNAIQLLEVPENSLFIDVGANRGESVNSIQMLVQKPHKIIAFEPNEFIFQKLEKVFEDDDNIHLYCMGLSDKKESLKLYVPYYKKYMFDGLASFSYENAAMWLKNNMFNYKEKNLRIKEITCELNSLDSLELQPFFIKLDVQGFEFKALKGAQKTLQQHKPILLIETPSAKVNNFVKEFGYHAYYYEKAKLKKGFGILNTFYFTSKHLNQIIKC